jgi:HxlR-like helix-turn-helix
LRERRKSRLRGRSSPLEVVMEKKATAASCPWNLSTVPTQERSERYEYRLTDKGRDLRVPLLALMQWGDQYLSAKPPRLARRLSDHTPVAVAILAPDGTRVDPADVETVVA